jgi:hypothetical protein
VSSKIVNQEAVATLRMKEESKPSILLSLPPELWHDIMRTTQNWIHPDQYFSAEHIERRQTLLNAALAHRILQPYAQEELLRILFVSSEVQLNTLMKALEGSSRLAGYAKRTEVIQLFSIMEDEGEGLNELLMTLFDECCNSKTLDMEHSKVRLSTISKSSVLRSAGQTLT